ncbi:hypothetical protein D9619_003641 [Psilocybe cf. subviscida]|uniref:Uncharacterized protein n=1 Tax=Psilocybe cf. subviscida TaxID=2480587 RepID=A0A8H5AW05_9AGAR|nr:hypothetical protein D9619_003641 [Psilocybe cf. subviscida]
MLLVQPPGEGPFPPAVTVPAIQVRGPIPAASMSEIDLGANCLYLGSGGACGKFAAQETTPKGSTLSPPPAIMSERVESSTPSLGLFSRIKRHLSMTNLRPSATTTSQEHVEAVVGGQELQSAATRAGTGARENAFTSGPVVSFASSPSFHSALPAPSTIDSTLDSCPDTTRSVSTPPSLPRDSLTSSPSLYSRESADASDLASYIGSSSSFFAATARGRDGRKSRIGSEECDDACTDGSASVAGHGSLMSESETSRADFTDVLDYDTPEASAADCYMPYVPLIMQHERLQHHLRTRVSLDEVASLARSSVSSKPSVRPRATMASLRDTYKAPKTKASGARPRKHVPPPLKASSSRLRSNSPTMGAPCNLGENTQREPHSPTSTVSSKSPITPQTHFNFTTDAHPHTIKESTEQIDEGDDEFLQGIRAGKVEESKLHIFTTSSQTAAPNVNVHPPTPPLPSLQPAFVEEYTQSKSPIGVIDAIDQKSAFFAPPPSPTRSISRRCSAKAPPPMAPPPSGPLPLPPVPSTSFESSRPTMEPSMPFYSPPNAHHEWPTTHRTPPFINGSPAPTTGMLPVFKKPSQAENVGAESQSLLDFTPANDSGVAFGDHRISWDSVNTESVPSSAFFSARSHFSDDDVDHDDDNDDDESSLRLSLTERLDSDALSDSSCTSSEGTEGYAQNAIVTANTRANATTARHLPTRLIGVGRQQLEPTSGNTIVDWTLTLGSPSPRRVSKQQSLADVPGSRYLRSGSVALSAHPASEDSECEAPTASMPSTARKLAIPAIGIDAPFPDRVNLRTRTKSESALGKRTPSGALAARAATPNRNGNDDWTLSMPLPFFAKPAKATVSVSRADAQDDGVRFTEPQKDIVVTVAGVDLYQRNHVRQECDQDEVSPAEDDTASAAPNVFTVPRVVSAGSGIESATRSKSDAKRISLLDEQVFDTVAGEESNENLAKLDILSRDLARFNDLLRHSKSLLEMRPGSSGSETQSDSHSFSSSVIGIFQGNEGLAGTSSPARKQVCRDEIQVTSYAAPPIVPSAHPSKSQLPVEKPEISSDSIDDHVAESISPMRFSSLAPPAPGSGGYRSSVISTSSTSSSATVTPMKIRSLLPSASPPVMNSTQKTSFSVRKGESRSPPSSSTPVVKHGLVVGSALKPSFRQSKSVGSSRSLRIDTDTTNLSVKPIADKDSLGGEITPKNTSYVSPPSPSVPVEDEVLSTFLLEPLATCTDSGTATSMVGDPAPTHTASTGAHSRRASCSSLTLRTCASFSGSPSSKMHAESLTMSSSALPPPCLNSSTSCLTPSEVLSSVGQASHTTEVMLKIGASKSKGTVHQDIGTNLETKLLPLRSSSLSSGISSKSSMGSTRPVAPNLEYRIRQLRLLGVDASPLLISHTDSAQIVREANTLNKTSTVPEIDADSVCSGSHHSVRSSFSNHYIDQGMSSTESESTL